MDLLPTIQKIFDMIPVIVGGLRDVISGALTSLGVDPLVWYPLIIGILAIIGAYYLLKQFVTTNLFWKLRTILNLLLIALLIFIIFVYVG